MIGVQDIKSKNEQTYGGKRQTLIWCYIPTANMVRIPNDLYMFEYNIDFRWCPIYPNYIKIVYRAVAQCTDEYVILIFMTWAMKVTCITLPKVN